MSLAKYNYNNDKYNVEYVKNQGKFFKKSCESRLNIKGGDVTYGNSSL